MVKTVCSKGSVSVVFCQVSIFLLGAEVAAALKDQFSDIALEVIHRGQPKAFQRSSKHVILRVLSLLFTRAGVVLLLLTSTELCC